MLAQAARAIVTIEEETVSNSDRVETEIKLRVESASQGLAMLEAAGFQVSRERVYESNAIYDLPGGVLRARSCLLRVRRVGANTILTFKGAPTAGKHKSREEIETGVSDASAFTTILERLGYSVSFEYEKYRTEFSRVDESGIATLDETPIGTFVELEGAAEWIDAAAASLGVTEAGYITASYARLFIEWCAARGIESNRMVFGEHLSSSGGDSN